MICTSSSFFYLKCRFGSFMFHNEGFVFMLQIYCSQYYHYYSYRVIFSSRSYFFWLGVPAWLLWTMSFWLLVDLSVIPGRQSSLNCCMPLERASLMGLLEFQSVSTALFVSNISFLHPGSRDDATGCCDVGDATQKAVAWKNESLSEMTVNVDICCFVFLMSLKRRVWWNMKATNLISQNLLLQRSLCAAWERETSWMQITDASVLQETGSVSAPS